MKTTAHHQLADAQPIPKHSYPPVHRPPCLMLSMRPQSVGYPLGQLGSAIPAVSPPKSLLTPSACSMAGWSGKQEMSWHCVSAAQ